MLPLLAIDLYQVLDTSDLPAGIVNIDAGVFLGVMILRLNVLSNCLRN
jgi:hypothetical protein